MKAILPLIVLVLIAFFVGLLLPRGCGSGGGTGGSGPSQAGNDASRALVMVGEVSIEGDKYLIDGRPASLDDVLSLGESLKKNGQTLYLRRMGTARYLTDKRLVDELNSRGIPYTVISDFKK
jgi:hypothetical protein